MLDLEKNHPLNLFELEKSHHVSLIVIFKNEPKYPKKEDNMIIKYSCPLYTFKSNLLSDPSIPCDADALMG